MKRSLFDKNLILMELKNSYWIGIVYFIGMVCVELMLLPNYKIEIVKHVEKKVFPSSLIFLVIGSVIVGGALFKFLNTKKSAEFMYSFPVCKTKLFFSKFIAGLILLVPATTLIFLWISINIIDKIGNSGQVVHYSVILIYIFIILVQILAFVIGIGGALITSSFCAGGLLSGMFILLPHVFKYFFESFKHTWMWSVSSSYHGMESGYESYIMPLSNIYMYDLKGFYVSMKGYMAVIMACIIVYTAVAYILFIRRKEERAGDMVTLSWMKPILRVGFTVCAVLLISLFISDAEYAGSNGWRYILWYGITSIIAYASVNMLIEKKIREAITRGSIIKMVIITIIICITPVFLWMDIPDIGRKKISIAKGEVISFHIDRSHEYLNFTARSKDDEFLDSVQELLDYMYRMRNEGDEFYFGRIISINDKYKDGWKSKLFLKYDPEVEENFDWEKIYTSNEYRMSCFQGIESPEGVDHISLKKGFGDMDITNPNRIVKRDAIEKIYWAIKKDREVMTYEQLIDDKGVCAINLVVNKAKHVESYPVIITEEYENTLKTIKDLGLEKQAFLSPEEIDSIIVKDSLKDRSRVITDKDEIKELIGVFNSSFIKYPYVYDGRSIQINIVQNEAGENDYKNSCYVPYDEAFQFLEE